MATMSGYHGERVKGDFIKRNQKELLTIFNFHYGKLPSYQAIDRTLDKIDFDELILVFLD